MKGLYPNCKGNTTGIVSLDAHHQTKIHFAKTHHLHSNAEHVLEKEETT